MSTDQLSNISYTNKDFNAIYSELLEYATKLSYKWDPTSSDESDPGVVLLKLCALVADKDNYNIDKNTLELMPASVTQLPAARQIFDQCGYTMSYYRSAQGQLQLTMLSEPTDENSTDENGTALKFKYKLPRFTMFSDIDNNIVYSSMEEVLFDRTQERPETTQVVDVIQGIATEYTVNNDPIITLSNLDSRNRLYFTDTDVAENGIFISSANSNGDDYTSWTKVNILELEAPGTRCYRFGIDLETDICYIEFPEDIDSIIGEGIKITYIKTNGVVGNVAKKYISAFYSDTNIIRIDEKGSETELSVTTDNIHITNPVSIINGKDPETIDEAYKNYKRVKNTFDNLVSLQDYTDYMVSANYASNGYVCDRTNDIQHVYSIVTQEAYSNIFNKVITNKRSVRGTLENNTQIVVYGSDGEPLKDTQENIIETNIAAGTSLQILVDEPAMNAFDLCVYGLQYVPNVVDSTTYIQSFTMIPYESNNKTDTTLTSNDGYITYLNNSDESIKSIQHNFIKHESNQILMVKNKYPIIAKILPQHKLTTAQIIDIQANVKLALFKALNSKVVDFSSAASYELIYDTILTSDTRIKSVALDYPTYETYVIYKDDDDVYREMRIDNESIGGYIPITKTSELQNMEKTEIYENKNGSFVALTDDSTIDKSVQYYRYDDEHEKLWNDFRANIFAKSVLAGVTPLYNQDTTFALGPNQTNLRMIDNVYRVTTNTNIRGTFDTNGTLWESNRETTSHENILLSSPNYVNENQYSSYVKMIYDFPSLHKNGEGMTALAKDNIFELSVDEGKNDFIAFFWKAAEEDEYYTYIKYDNSDNSLAKYISASFSMAAKQPVPTGLFPNDRAESSWETVIKYVRDLETTGFKEHTEMSAPINNLDMTLTQLVSKLSSSREQNVLTGSQTVYTKKPNTIEITNSKNGTDKVFWILDENNGTKSVLFDDSTLSETETRNNVTWYVHEYTLKTGEYLLYANPQMTTMHMLGAGTLLKLKTSLKPDDTNFVWSCDILDYSELLEKGPDILRNSWFTINRDNSELFATEMQQIQIGPKHKIIVTVPSPSDFDNPDDFYLSGEGTQLPAPAQVTYMDSTSGTATRLASVPDGWFARTMLNLETTSSVPQMIQDSRYDMYGNDVNYDENLLLFDQTVKLYSMDSENTETTHTINGNSYLISSVELNIAGGERVRVSSIDLDGTELPTSFLAYNVTPVPDPNKESDSYPGDIKITYPENSFVCTIAITEPHLQQQGTKVPLSTMQLLPGNYLVSLTTDNLSAINALSFDIQEVHEGALYDPEITLERFFNDTSTTNFLYKIHISGNDPVQITPEVTFINSEAVTVTLEEFYKYSTKTLSSIRTTYVTGETDSFEANVLSLLNELDTDRTFNYLYQVDSAIRIDNPLVSSTFLTTSHIYNPFTICEWDVNNYSAGIDILNNVR